MRTAFFAAIAGILAAAIGCSDLTPDEKRREAGNVGGIVTNDAATVKPAAPATDATAATPPSPAAAEPPPAETVQEKAAVGAGQKGHYSEGIITTPLSTYFRAQEMINFNLQIPSGMNYFKAQHDRFPKDMDEFRTEILEPRGVKLPELPPNHKYVYNAEKGELMVERPKP